MPLLGSRLSCGARNTGPLSEFDGNTGVWIETVPICDCAGQVTGAFDFRGKLEFGQNTRPGAVAGFSPAPRGSVTRAADPMLLYFTSGTTAKPKMVLHSQQSYPVGHLSTMYWIGLRPARQADGNLVADREAVDCEVHCVF